LSVFFSEYNVYQPSPLNEKVLREKRKKLKETLDRVLRLYVSNDKLKSIFFKYINKMCIVKFLAQ